MLEVAAIEFTQAAEVLVPTTAAFRLGTVRLWAADGLEGHVLKGHENPVIGALHLKDGRILTWGKDSTTRLWPGSSEQLVTRAEDVVENIADLSAAEQCELNLADAKDC